MSTAEQAEHGWSIDHQEKAIRSWGESQGLHVLGIFRDAGRSGRTMKRPGLLALLTLMQQRGVGVVVMKSQDRLSRAVDHSLTLRRWMHQQGSDLLFLDGAMHLRADEPRHGGDLGNQLISSLTAVLAEEEIAQLSRRILPSLGAAARAGRRGGRLPLGYQLDAGGSIAIDQHEAAILLRVVDRLRDGDGLSQIARRLVVEGVRDSRGTIVSFDRLHGALTNRYLLGDLVYAMPAEVPQDGGRTLEIQNHHQAIFDPVVFGEIQDLLRARARSAETPDQTLAKRRAGRQRQRRANRLPPSGDLLAAIAPPARPVHGAMAPEALRCAHCGGPMYASLQTVGAVGHRRRMAVYLCRFHKDRGAAFCPQPPVRCDDVDEVVAAAVIAWLRQRPGPSVQTAAPAVPTPTKAGDDLRVAESERNRLRQAMERLGELAPDILAERLAAAEATILRLANLAQREAGQVPLPQGVAWDFRRNPRATWDKLDVSGRRAVMQPMLDQVQIRDKSVVFLAVRDDDGQVHRIDGSLVEGAVP
ncbi:hypothetical protein LBMAG53_25720 [Planctomycetota bacterium]|nr:hypothetical protein LBMAG53_25720 [Planctomycetota bacterium]